MDMLIKCSIVILFFALFVEETVNYPVFNTEICYRCVYQTNSLCVRNGIGANNAA